jgi:phage gp36-like protein
MAYCAQADISPGKLSTTQLKKLTSEDGLTVVDAVVTQAIAEADSDIDSYGGRRYVVPFSPVPAKVKQLSVAIAVYKLHEKRIAVFAGEIPKSIRDMYDDAIAFLKDVSKGNAVIDGAVTPSENTKRTGGSFSANDRVFGKDSLDLL